MRNTRNNWKDSCSSSHKRKCWCEEHHERKCSCVHEKHHEKEVKRHQCKGCACDQLRRLQSQTPVDVFLSGGQVLSGLFFVNFDKDTCCAFFIDPSTTVPSTLIIDCQDILAIRLLAAAA
ncbi:hydrolase [Psychrobacillus vulpis]|uniref:hydrolase n=1 Tax=Psychrobacillus vulpis TaxID=2325572 RepID=UPI001F0D4025|nr:hydrolase [Psychrobacillus vulpis]